MDVLYIETTNRKQQETTRRKQEEEIAPNQAAEINVQENRQGRPLHCDKTKTC